MAISLERLTEAVLTTLREAKTEAERHAALKVAELCGHNMDEALVDPDQPFPEVPVDPVLAAVRAEGRAAGLREAAHKTQTVRDELAGYLPPGPGRDGAFGALDEATARLQAMGRALIATRDGQSP